LKCLKDLNIRPETEKTSESSRKYTGIDNMGKSFLIRTQKPQHHREIMNKWDYINLNSFCTTKEIVTRLKRNHTKWEKIFASYSSNKGLISRTYR
jgi:hypothetical protein